MGVKYINIYSADNLNSVCRNIDRNNLFIPSNLTDEYKACEYFSS